LLSIWLLLVVAVRQWAGAAQAVIAPMFRANHLVAGHLLNQA
jgi:hypothetical protein